MMITSVAAGITSSSGTPFGGIVFSIELCTTIFLVSNLWKLFVCAGIVKMIFEIGVYCEFLKTIKSAEVPSVEIYSNIPHYILIGIICGWLASLWLYTFSLFTQFKGQTKYKLLSKYISNLIYIVLIIILLLPSCLYPVLNTGSELLIMEMELWYQVCGLSTFFMRIRRLIGPLDKYGVL